MKFLLHSILHTLPETNAAPELLGLEDEISFWGSGRCELLVLGSVSLVTRWWFQIFFYFHPKNWGKIPSWTYVFFKWPETIN